MSFQKGLFSIVLLLAFILATGSTSGQNSHEGATCIGSTDCDDDLMVVMNGRCLQLTCTGGANNFYYCQHVSLSGGPCVTTGTANVNCGTDCYSFDCGAPSTIHLTSCDFTNCDISVPPVYYTGGVTIEKTCVH